MKATGYFLTSISSGFAEDEAENNLTNELYDKFTHNELSGIDVVKRIIEFTESSVNDPESYSENIDNAIYQDENFILSYDGYSGTISVYKTFID